MAKCNWFRTAASLAVFIIMASFLASSMIGRAKGAEESGFYQSEGFVYGVSGEVVSVYADGSAWDFYGEDFSVGQTVLLTMDDMGTIAVYDDMVVDCE